MQEPREELSRRPQEAAAPQSWQEEDTPDDRVMCRSAGDQLVICASPGPSKTSRSMFLFAAMWLAFMALFTNKVASDNVGGLEMAVPFIIIALFWVFGLAMFYIWLLGRFGKTHVLLEPGRLVLRFGLFGLNRFREFALDEDSEAELVVSYHLNNRPVYAVSVSTATGDAKFGRFLSNEVKEWLVARIDRHLGR